jgi:hypothetical protein
MKLVFGPANDKFVQKGRPKCLLDEDSQLTTVLAKTDCVRENDLEVKFSLSTSRSGKGQSSGLSGCSVNKKSVFQL